MHVVVLALLLAAPTVEAPADWSCDPERWGDGICDCACTAADEIDCREPCQRDDGDDDADDVDDDSGSGCAQADSAWPGVLSMWLLLRRRRPR
jgi:hypothetical protein